LRTREPTSARRQQSQLSTDAHRIRGASVIRLLRAQKQLCLTLHRKSCSKWAKIPATLGQTSHKLNKGRRSTLAITLLRHKLLLFEYMFPETLGFCFLDRTFIRISFRLLELYRRHAVRVTTLDAHAHYQCTIRDTAALTQAAASFELQTEFSITQCLPCTTKVMLHFLLHSMCNDTVVLS
jgi:hypothetical protein